MTRKENELVSALKVLLMCHGKTISKTDPKAVEQAMDALGALDRKVVRDAWANAEEEVPLICPHCLADLHGELIPKEKREDYGGALFFSKVVGVIVNDRVAYWKCPSCDRDWDMTGKLPGGYRTCEVILVNLPAK